MGWDVTVVVFSFLANDAKFKKQKTFFVFIETRVEVWENEKLKWEHEPPQLVISVLVAECP